MGRFLYDEFLMARRLFEEASDTLKIDFKKLCFEGPESELQLTENTQPALLLVSMVSYRVANDIMPLKIIAGAGHSVGEYAALVASGVLPFTEALRAVRLRGQAMQKAVPVGQGAMCAVMGPTDENVRKLCKLVESESGEKPLEPANFNCPGQVVISGSAKAMEWLKAKVNPEWISQHLGPDVGRIKFIPLSVSAPFHCSLMKPAEKEMALVLNAIEFSSPRFSVVQNLTASITSEPSEIRSHLIGQISGTVLWTQCQELLFKKCWSAGSAQFIEFGSGKVLAGLAKKIASGTEYAETLKIYGLNSLDDLKTLEDAAKKQATIETTNEA